MIACAVLQGAKKCGVTNSVKISTNSSKIFFHIMAKQAVNGKTIATFSTYPLQEWLWRAEPRKL
jgi:hypothetical protein